MMSLGSTHADPQKPRAPFLAHVRQAPDGSFVIHDLEEHLRAVANLAGEFASTFGRPIGATWQGCGMTLEKSSLIS